MQVEITQKGVYDAKGNQVAVGDVIDVKGDTMPAWLVNKAREVGGKKGKTAVTNPAENPVPSSYEAKHRGGGSYSVMLGDEEVVKGLNKDQAEKFNDLSPEEKAEQVKGATAE